MMLDLDAHYKLVRPISPNLWKFLNQSLFVALILAAGRLLAAEALSGSTESAADQLKQLNDRTIIGSYMSLDTEWDQFKHGAEKASGRQ